MNNFTIPTHLSIDFVNTSFTRINNVFSKGRVRVYYKYGNRNGTWITDEVATQLNSTIGGVPIMACFNPETNDFEEHADWGGRKKPYGFIPFEHEPKWEVSENGKEYFAVDAIIWTGIFPEAEMLPGKSQSMELDPESIIGEWKVVGGEPYFVFENASFLSLCALGADYLPCFEESAFYSLGKKTKDYFLKILSNQEEKGGEEMKDKENKTVNATEFSTKTEDVEGKVITAEEETAKAEDEAVKETTEENKEQETAEDNKAEFKEETKTEEVETEKVETEETGEVETEEEVVNYQELYDQETSKVKDLEEQVGNYSEQIEELKKELTSLNSFKETVEMETKKETINKFAKKLTEEELAPFKEKINEYSIDDLKKELSIVYTEKTIDIEETNERTSYVSNGKEKVDAIAKLLREVK